LKSKLSKNTVEKKENETLNSLDMLSLVHGDVAQKLHPKETQATQTSSSSLMVKSRYQKKFETLKQKLDQMSSDSENETI